MRPIEADTLRLISRMPLIDRLEAVAVSGRSRSAVYNAFDALERDGLAASVPHASDLIPSIRRYFPTADGLHRLAEEEGFPVEDMLRNRPVSAQWLRVLMERLDALAVIYRLASAISGIEHPIRFRWFRAMPMDAAVALRDGRVIAVVRQGTATDRTGFSKRLWRLGQEERPAAVLMLMPDEARLRHARRLVAGAPSIAYLALESDAASAGAGAAIWRTPSGAALLDLRTALEHTGSRGPWPGDETPARASLPEAIDENTDEDWMLPSVLRPVDKRAIDLISDWPWMSHAHMGALIGLKRSRLSEVVVRLRELGLAVDVPIEGRRRLAVTDRALAMLARRDRASVGAARKRWSVTPVDDGKLMTWRNVSGTRSRQLLRNVEHTAAVHGFVAALARQARSRSREIVQLDPPRRASRYFHHNDRMRSVQPDAFGMLHRGNAVRPFFLEWERRAVRPVTMAARLAPYLRYYSTHRPTDDHGAQPDVLIVFDDDIAQTHFLRVAREEMARTGVSVPLLVSHRKLLEQEGPLGRAWLTPGVLEPVQAFRAP
ncbi:MAG: hypothetical protein F4X57_06450 [Chloroflexi bacterium]|nr:hypothetical protein [Chloroflexota bacterium]